MTFERVALVASVVLLAGCVLVTTLLVLTRLLRDRAERRRLHVKSSVWGVVLTLRSGEADSVFVTLLALLAEEVSFRRYRGLADLLRAIYAAAEENVGYRQLNAWWRLGGLVEVVGRQAHHWGDMQRVGFDRS